MNLVAPLVLGLFGPLGPAIWQPVAFAENWQSPAGMILVMLLVGIAGLYVLALCARIVIVNADVLFTAPKGNTPPPWPIRALLIFTCSGVSFAHGSNDGQKGMGLIMLILIGTVPPLTPSITRSPLAIRRPSSPPANRPRRFLTST